MIKTLLKKLANKFGYDILHLPTDPLIRRRLDLFRQYQINLIFDIGANKGQFVTRIRELGYKGRIVSFEPLSEAYSLLLQKTKNDPFWEAANLALGDFNGETTINIAQNSYSSSMLNVLPEHLASAPDSKYIGTETIHVKTLDNVIDDYFNENDRLYVKIDTQGYEKKVIDGLKKSIDKIIGFQMELSLIPLYAEETLMQEMIMELKSLGYKLKLIETGHMNYNTGEILQVEGYFFR